MPTTFAVIILADQTDARRSSLEQELERRVQLDLEAAEETLDFLDAADVSALDRNTKTIVVVFCKGPVGSAEKVAIEECKQRKLQILPVVEDLQRFEELAPEELKPFNGFELRPAEKNDMGELAGLILEGLGLQRGRRKIFISYARVDTAAIARQLREAFTHRWYTVFHDTVSIRPGRAFQSELLHELCDSDVMLLLNSKNAAKRPYVKEEIKFAHAANIGIVEVLWLLRTDSDGELLSDSAVREILQLVARERTELQKTREEGLRRSILAYVKRHRDWEAVSHLGRFVTLRNPVQGPASTMRLNIALGMPTSMELQEAWKFGAEHDPKRIVYDRNGLTNAMAEHLAFLGGRLSLELLDVDECLSWGVIT
jgi:TIR domain